MSARRLMLCFFVLGSLLILSLFVTVATEIDGVGASLAKNPDFAEALRYFSPEAIRVGKELSLLRLRHFLQIQILTLSALVFLLGSHWTELLWKRVQKRSGRMATFLYCWVVLVLLKLIRAPEEIQAGYFLERNYG